MVKRATRKDVSVLAGISPAVVSNVINGTGYVSPKTRTAVENAIKTLNYHPNHVARSLRTKHTNQFIVIVNEIRNEFFAEIAYSMEQCAHSNGFTTLISNARNDKAFVNHLISRQADGVFVYSQKMDTKLINLFAKSGINTVVCSNMQREDLDPSITKLYVDSQSGIFEAMNHLKGRGHTRIGYIHGIDVISSGANDVRTIAYRQSLKESGIPYDADIVCLNAVLSDIFDVVKGLLSKANPPTTFLCGNDNFANAVMYALIKLGYRVPQDISVVGYGDIALTSIVYPTISSIRLPKKELGVVAAEILMRRLEDEECPDVTFPTKFIERESTMQIPN